MQPPDREALTRLLVRPPRAAYLTALGILKDRESAREAVAQATLQAWEHFAHHRGDASLATWFVCIARNEALMEHRRRQRAALRDPEFMRDQPAVSTPEALALARERGRLLAQVIRSLPDKYRATVRYVYYEELPLAAAAQSMGVTTDCCRSRAYRARRLLYDRLTQPYAQGPTA